MSTKKLTFSKLGFILTAAGSAVGLGNIWRFPYLTTQHGGGTFIFVYIICIAIIGFSLLIAEFIIGKYLGHPFLENLKKLKHHQIISKLLYINLLLATIIMSFYFIVAGWTLYYFANSLTAFIHYQNNLNPIYYQHIFDNLLANPMQIFLYAFAFLLITSVINYKGIIEGVEKINLFVLPLLFILLAIMVIKILNLPNSSIGVKYLLQFHLADFNLKLFVNALGQAFFSLSVGLSNMIIFATFVPKTYNLKTSAISISIIATLVGIVSAFLVIPALFAFNYSLDNSGPGLTFITLPLVFAQMHFGIIFASLFFFVMVIAAITSTIALIELVIPYLSQLFNITRGQAIIVNILIISCCLLVQALSFNVFSDVRIFHNTIFDFSNLFSSILFIFSATLISFMIGWGMNKSDVYNEITNNGTISFPYFKTWLFTIRYILPVIITSIIITSII